jgi:hypothetical protein
MRLYDGPEEDDGMGDITEALEQTALKNWSWFASFI